MRTKHDSTYKTEYHRNELKSLWSSPTQLLPFVDQLLLMRLNLSILGHIHLVNWDLESIESVGPALNGCLILNAVKVRAVSRPKRSRRPLAKLLHLASVGARRYGGVEAARLHSVLNPVDDSSHVVLRVRARLKSVGIAVRRAGNEVELVPVGHGFLSLSIGHVRVHDRANGLPVVDRGCSRDGRVRFTVVVDHLGAGRLERREVGESGLQAVEVADHADVHPSYEIIVGDVVEVGKVVQVEQLDELGHVLATSGRDVELPLAGRIVVRWLGVAKLRANLPREVCTLALGVMKAIVDTLRQCNIIGVDGAVLFGLSTGLASWHLTLAEATLAEPKAKGSTGLGSTVVAFADQRAEIEVEFAKVGAGDDTCSDMC